MGEEVEITTKSPSRLPSRSTPLCPLPRISASVSIPPWRIALTWQFEREEPRGAMLRPRLLSGLFVCLFPGIECRLSFFYSPHLGTCLYSAGCYPASPPLCASLPASLHEPITQTTLPFLTGLFHSHPRFYSPGMGSSEPLLISPVLPPSPTLAQIIVCGIISAFSTTG